MDPIGFGLENYDASGAWRDREGSFPVDSSGTLPGGASFKGPGELKQILRAQPDLFVRLHKIVAGWLATDVDPAWPPEVKNRALAEQLEAALTDRLVGDVRQERDEKNC